MNLINKPNSVPTEETPATPDLDPDAKAYLCITRLDADRFPPRLEHTDDAHACVIVACVFVVRPMQVAVHYHEDTTLQ